MAISILDKINSPKDLKRLSHSELHRLAREIRRLIIDVVSQNGGHLASNLGMVEVTLALHRVFDAPKDKIVWDVGHQAYTHKLLTGRRDRFHTLRQWQGISGFPKREESPYDTFNTGHASTAVSAALGLAEGARYKGERNFTIAVVGDGALTGGMAFEGLNQAGTLKGELIVVLNDNEMSISQSVGALSSYLSRIQTGQVYHTFKKQAEYALKHIPAVGERMVDVAFRVKEAMKSLARHLTIFDELGFEYVGPVDGHDLEKLLEVFEAAKSLEGPILIHVHTKKGKGYLPAESQSHLFHSAKPFDKETGKFKPGKGVLPYTHFFVETLIRLAQQDDKIIAITAAMPGGTGLDRFGNIFPDRYYDVGIAEQHAVTFAAGLAQEGLKPVVAIYSTFLQRAFDQVFHDVCLQNLPVVFALDRAGIVPGDGPTHNGVFDLSYLRHLPGMALMAPKDENELQHMLYTALAAPGSPKLGPVAIRYPKSAGVGVPLDKDFKRLPIGKAEILEEGEDILILAIGSMVYPALQAAGLLRQEGIGATVVNARFVKPLDRELIGRLSKKTGYVLTVEDNTVVGGFGSAVLELLAQENLFSAKVKCLGVPDRLLEHGPRELLCHQCGLDAEGIAAGARELLKTKPSPRRKKQ